MNRSRIVIVIAVMVLATITVIFSYMNNKVTEEYDFKIYFFNAGKADAILISKNDKYILIDTGEESFGSDILKYFKNHNINRLEYLIITHFDKDHVGSASKIIDNIEIGEVIQNNLPKTSEYYTNYLTALSNKLITPTTVSENYELVFEDLEIIVNGSLITYDSNESNNSSLIVSIKNGDNNFLFMGDAENARIKDYLNSNTDTYDFIKVPYHGNYLKKLDNLLDVVKPKYGVITCSATEGCESETLKLLNNYNVKYYMTKNGSISVLSNGKKIIIKQ